MGVTITGDQRDAIYAAVMNHQRWGADLWRAVERQQFTEAKRLGRAFAESRRLLDVCLETDNRDTVALTLPPGELADAGLAARRRWGARVEPG